MSSVPGLRGAGAVAAPAGLRVVLGLGFGRRVAECWRAIALDRQAQHLADGELIDIGEVVGLTQVVDGDTVGLGDVPERVAALDGVLRARGDRCWAGCGVAGAAC